MDGLTHLDKMNGPIIKGLQKLVGSGIQFELDLFHHSLQYQESR
jgi:hypothetical protein